MTHRQEGQEQKEGQTNNMPGREEVEVVSPRSLSVTPLPAGHIGDLPLTPVFYDLASSGCVEMLFIGAGHCDAAASRHIARWGRCESSVVRNNCCLCMELFFNSLLPFEDYGFG